jgi:hypothetical protein
MGDFNWSGSNINAAVKQVKETGKVDLKKIEASSSKPTAQPTIKEWDKTYQPIIENLKLEDKFNYQSSKHIMRAVNGRYDKVMGQLKTDDPALYKKFQQFKSSSQAFADGLITYQKTGNPEAINKNWLSSTTLFTEIANKLDYSQNKKYAVDSEANVLTREQYEKNDQEAHAGDGYSTNAKVIFNGDELLADYEKMGTSSEYNKLKNINKVWQSEIKKKTEPIVTSWVSTSLKNIDPTDKTNAKNNDQAWALSVDLLKHVSQYGTVDRPNLRKQDKELAMSIRKQMWGKGLKEQLEVLKNNSEKLEGMSNRLGFHGSTKLLNAHKKTIGDNIQNYPETDTRQRNEFANEDMDSITYMLGHYKDFKNIDVDLRSKALELNKVNWEVTKDSNGLDINKKQFDVAMDALVDAKGNIMTYEKWKQNLRGQQDPSKNVYIKGGTPTFGSAFRNVKSENIKNENALGQLWEQNKTNNYNDPYQYFTGQTNKEGVEEDLTAIYRGLKKGYKKEFSNIKNDQVYQSSLLLNGFGNNRNRTVKHIGLDMSIDENFNLKSSTSKKQENLNKVLSLMKDANGEIAKEGVTFFNDEQAKKGLFAKQASDLTGQQKYNQDIASDFLKGDLSNVTMEFFRNTNVSGQVAYSFYNKKTKKSMVMYVPAEKVSKNKGVGEDLYVNTAKSLVDFNFAAKGFKDMKIYQAKNKPAYESAKLVYDDNTDSYVGKMYYWNEEGKVELYKHVMPSAQAMTVKGATDTFNKFLSTYSKTLM